MRLRPRDASFVLLAALLTLAFWKLRLSDPVVGFERSSGDLYHQIYPMWVRAAAMMKAGHLPLWNPYQMCGHPFQASVLYGIFYPLNFARFVLPAEIAIEATMVLHLWLAWVFTFLFLRAGIGTGAVGAATGATAFALGGFVVTDAIWFSPAIGSLIWAPMAFLSAEKLLQRRGASWLVLLSVAVAMPILAGWLQTWMHMLHALGLYCVVRAAFLVADRGERSTVLSRMILIGMGIALGIGLAAVQLLPSLELQLLGWRRPGGLSVAQQLAMGSPSMSMLLGQAVESEAGFPRPIYLGIVALLFLPLSLVGAQRPRFSQIAALWAVLVWSLAVTLGPSTDLYWLYRTLPGGTWFRIPSRMLCFYALAGSALFAIAIDALRRERSTARHAISVVAYVAIGMTLLGIGVSTRSIAYGAIGFVALLLAAPKVSPVVRHAAFGMIGALLVFDLFSATIDRAARPFHDLTAYEKHGAMFDYLRDHQELGRTYMHESWPILPAIAAKQGTLRGIYMVSDHEVLTLERYARYCRAMWQGTDVTSTDNAFIGFCVLGPGPAKLAMLNMLGVRFVVAQKTGLGNLFGLMTTIGWQAVYTSDDTYVVYENPSPLPRAYVAYDRVVATSDEVALSAIAHASIDARKTVMLEKDSEGGPLSNERSAQPIVPAKISRYEPALVEVEVSGPTAGVLVLTDTFYPGWKADVDGVTVPIHRANYLFRGVPVPAGAHRVTFRFDPLSLTCGAVVSGLSALALALVCLRAARGRPHPPA